MEPFINVIGEDLTISSDPECPTKPEQSLKEPALFVGSDISANTYQQIADILLKGQQFNLDGYKDLCIKRRIAARIRAINCYDTATYTELLQNDTNEQTQLLATLSIHVSQFFRNPTLFNVLENRILPELLQSSRDNLGKIRIWSVGCANGEEPYSVALLCHKQHRKGDSLAIIGTDLSPKALTRAKRGLFPAERTNGVPSEMLQKFFSPQEQHYQLDDQIRKRVQFFRHDILTDKPFYRADLILCRNLLIYFSREQQRQVLEELAAALLPGGYLVLGRAETLVPACRGLFKCIDPAERIYQRLKTEE